MTFLLKFNFDEYVKMRKINNCWTEWNFRRCKYLFTQKLYKKLNFEEFVKNVQKEINCWWNKRNFK